MKRKLGELVDRPLAYGVLQPGKPTEGGVPLVRIQDLHSGRLRASTMYRISRELHAEFKRTELRGGELLFSVVGTLGKVVEVPDELAGANISRALCVIAARAGIVRDYLRLVLSSREVQRWVVRAAHRNAQPVLNVGALRELEIPVPPLAEQRRIVTIVSSVEETIEKTQAVIAALEAVKGAVLHELMSRDWAERPGRDMFSLSGGYSPSALQLSGDGDVLFLKVDDLNHTANRRSIVDAALRFRGAENPSIRVHSPGCLVFPKRGAAIFKNRVRVLEQRAAVDPNLMVLTPRKGIDPGFLACLLLHIGLFNLSDNAGIPQINNKHLYPYRFPCPPLAEQRAIRNGIDAMEDRLEAEEHVKDSLEALKADLLAELLAGESRVGLIVP